jgi:hypothetical protein
VGFSPSAKADLHLIVLFQTLVACRVYLAARDIEYIEKRKETTSAYPKVIVSHTDELRDVLRPHPASSNRLKPVRAVDRREAVALSTAFIRHPATG